MSSEKPPTQKVVQQQPTPCLRAKPSEEMGERKGEGAMYGPPTQKPVQQQQPPLFAREAISNQRYICRLVAAHSATGAAHGQVPGLQTGLTCCVAGVEFIAGPHHVQLRLGEQLISNGAANGGLVKP